jgi:hypothetical protein
MSFVARQRAAVRVYIINAQDLDQGAVDLSLTWSGSLKCRERISSEANLYSICPIKDIESASIDDPVPSDGDDMISTTRAAEAVPGAATSASGPEEVTSSFPKQVAKPAAPPPKKVLPSFKIPKKASEGRPRSPDKSAGSEETGTSGSTSDLTPKSKSLQQYRSCK